MDDKKESGRSRPERPARLAQPATQSPQLHAKPHLWLILQGDTVDLIESREQPDLTTKKGERRKMLAGAYTDRDKAETALEAIRGRARGIVGKGEAR